MNADVNARSSGVQDLAFTFAFAFTGNERRSRSRSPINERVRERRSFERRSLMLCIWLCVELDFFFQIYYKNPQKMPINRFQFF